MYYQNSWAFYTTFTFDITSHRSVSLNLLSSKSRLKKKFWFTVPVPHKFRFFPRFFLQILKKMQVSLEYPSFNVLFYYFVQLLSLFSIINMLILVKILSPGKKSSKSRYRDASRRLRNTVIDDLQNPTWYLLTGLLWAT